MQKTLYRSRVNRLLGGVCGGLGEYFNVTPWLFRIIFLVINPSLLIYILIWIFVPENPAQKPAKQTPILIWIILIFLFIPLSFFIFNTLKLFFGF